MAKKDLEQYYATLCSQRNQVIEDIKEFEKECENNLVDPERVEQFKENMKPIISNWERVSFLMHLLNKPTKKKSEKAYNNTHSKFLKTLNVGNAPKAVIEENNRALKELDKMLTNKD